MNTMNINSQAFDDEDIHLRIAKQRGGYNNYYKTLLAVPQILTTTEILSSEFGLYLLPFVILAEFIRVFFNYQEKTRNKGLLSRIGKIAFYSSLGLAMAVTAIAATTIWPYVSCAIFTAKFIYNTVLTLGYVARLASLGFAKSDANTEYKAHCKRQLRKFSFNAACNLFGAIASAAVIALSLTTGGAAPIAIMATVSGVMAVNSFYLGWREFQQRPRNNVEENVSVETEILQIADNHKPGEGSFFHNDIILSLRRIKGETGQQLFLKTLINKKIKALALDKSKRSSYLFIIDSMQQVKRENKITFLQWLHDWLLDPKQLLQISGQKREIKNIKELMSFLDEHPNFRNDIFSSPQHGIGETEALLRTVAVYMNNKFPDNNEENFVIQKKCTSDNAHSYCPLFPTFAFDLNVSYTDLKCVALPKPSQQETPNRSIEYVPAIALK